MKDMNMHVAQSQFGQLRARLEASFSEPAVIVVTSANAGDGKSVTAFGLAESLAQAGHRVLLIDANAVSPTLSRMYELPYPSAGVDVGQLSTYAMPVDRQRFSGISLADERFEGGMSMEKVRSAMHDARLHFDFTIVDTARISTSELAVLFASIAEGTMLTLRSGRFPSAADAESVKTLTRVGANMLGVLSVGPSTIRAFSRNSSDAMDRIGLLTARRVQVRPVTVQSVSEVVDAVRPGART